MQLSRYRLFGKEKSKSKFHKQYKQQKTNKRFFKGSIFNKPRFSRKQKTGFIAGGIGILASLYYTIKSKLGNRPKELTKEDISEKLKKASLKSWQKEIKNPDAFDDKELPEDIKNILDAHQEEIFSQSYDTSYVTKIFDFLPGYIVKTKRPRSRITGAKAMTAVIDQYHLTHLFVPKKYLYVAPNGEMYVVSKLVEQSKEPITKEELKQLIFLAKKLVWIDGNKTNFLKTPQGIALIDTEAKMNEIC